MDEKKYWEIIQFAIEKEILSYDFYIKASHVTRFRRTKNMFLELAKEEEEHRKLLDNLIKERIAQPRIEATFDLKIDDYFKEVEFRPGMSYADIRRIAMKIEEYSLNVYNALGEATSNEDLKKIFSLLAQEEAKHKVKFEEEEFGK